jgi:hypothetical protein
MLTSGSASALRIRITTSGKQGRFTVPLDTSVANSARKASAEARVSVLVSTGFDSTGLTAAAGALTVGLPGAGGGLVETIGLPGAAGAEATVFGEDAVFAGTDSFSLPGADATFAIVVLY